MVCARIANTARSSGWIPVQTPFGRFQVESWPVTLDRDPRVPYYLVMPVELTTETVLTARPLAPWHVLEANRSGRGIMDARVQIRATREVQVWTLNEWTHLGEYDFTGCTWGPGGRAALDTMVRRSKVGF